jgi:hypothetical protein
VKDVPGAGLLASAKFDSGHRANAKPKNPTILSLLHDKSTIPV